MTFRQKIRTMRLAQATVVMLLVINVACAGNTAPTVPTVATNVSNRGTELMGAINSVQKAVIDAEASGALPRNAARSSMTVFQTIGANGEKAAGLLKQLVNMAPNSTEKQTAVQQIQAALDLVNSGLFEAIVPISDETTRNKVIDLAKAVSTTITIINREILQGVK